MNEDRFQEVRVNTVPRRRSRPTRPVYRFVRRYTAWPSGREMYFWEARVPGDSRVDQVSCPVDWFWSKP